MPHTWLEWIGFAALFFVGGFVLMLIANWWRRW